MTSKFRIGRVLWQSIALTFKNLVPLSALAGLCSLPMLYLLIEADSKTSARPFATTDLGDPLLLVSIVFGALTQVVLIHGVVMIMQGHRLKMGRCLRLGLQGSRSALTAALVLGAATSVSMSAQPLLGLVVAMLVMAFFLVAVPIAVVERSDAMTALGRSCVLTAGSRLRILALVLLLGVILMGVGIAIALVDLEGARAGLSVAGLFVAQLLGGALGAAISVLAYDELRLIKEGQSLDTVVAARIA